MNQQEATILTGLLNKNQLEPFVRYIRFPLFKNLQSGLQIEFTFPITALVGANGTNKSSILRAIQGAPEGSNLGNYWFSTEVDPIKESGAAANCFVYGYYHPKAKKIVEVLKTRVMDKVTKDPDYWEPSRPIVGYGMSRLSDKDKEYSALQTRWELITKHSIYLDFRHSLSAFDKYFYHNIGTRGSMGSKAKKDFLRQRSTHLKTAIELNMKSYHWYKERVLNKENLQLATSVVAHISELLGRNYTKIILIRHNLFNCDAYSCILHCSDLSYTEAFAGSGEFAVVRLVTEVLRAPERSIILLDEPEVSLHPGAQEKLVHFLFDQTKKRKHQIIISTHSPNIIRHLPNDAIKAFVYDHATGTVRLPSQSASPDEAFFYIGEPLSGKLSVIVEDVLAKEIVLKALRLGGEAFARRFEVKCFPGGSKTLWAHYVPIFAIENRTDTLVLLDGDERPMTELPDPNTVSVAAEHELVDILAKVSGTHINFNVDGGSLGANKDQENAYRRRLIAWARAHVAYLPGEMPPEAFLWDKMPKDTLALSVEEIQDAKKRFAALTGIELGRAAYETVSAQDILATQVRRLRGVSNTDADIIGIYKLLELTFA